MRNALDRYEEIAAEYYDPNRHPTAANFRAASRLVLEKLIPSLVTLSSAVVEVGCGSSLLMEVLTSASISVGTVTLVDSSPTMLAYSERWRRQGVRLLVADAEDLPLVDACADMVVSVLGDPYNTPRFWAEASRILRADGHVLYTTPSHAWSVAYRGGSGSAVFDRLEGDDLELPSIVLSPDAQRHVIEASGLRLERQEDVALRDLADPISPKLRVLTSSAAPVVTAYLARKL